MPSTGGASTSSHTVQLSIAPCTSLLDAGIPIQPEVTHIVDRCTATHLTNTPVNKELSFMSAINLDDTRSPNLNCVHVVTSCSFLLVGRLLIQMVCIWLLTKKAGGSRVAHIGILMIRVLRAKICQSIVIEVAEQRKRRRIIDMATFNINHLDVQR